MTLDEAIEHAAQQAKDCLTECRREHAQLAEWLRELKLLRAGWQPIETAPKDKQILLAGRYWSDEQGYFDRPLIGMWNPRNERWEAAWMCWFGVRPTHWMPLPTLPSNS